MITSLRKKEIFLEKRFEANAALRKSYSAFFHKLIDLDHREDIPVKEFVKPDSEVNLLLHHCVHKEDSTMAKLRAVFACEQNRVLVFH